MSDEREAMEHKIRWKIVEGLIVVRTALDALLDTAIEVLTPAPGPAVSGSISFGDPHARTDPSSDDPPNDLPTDETTT